MQPKSTAEIPATLLQSCECLLADIDDTVTRAGKISASTIDAFTDLANADIALVLVTGRSSGWAQAIQAYIPYVQIVVAENGLVSISGDGEVIPLRDDLSHSNVDLDRRAAALASDFELRPTVDSPFRLFERTFVREETIDAAAIAEMRCSLDRGFEIIASSIHLHLRHAGWGKSHGVAKVLELGLASSRHLSAESELFVIGDSGNDKDLFAAYHDRSVGVANVLKFARELGDAMPMYITDESEGLGFEAFVSTMLNARKKDA